MSNKVPFGKEGFKYFIGYKDAKKIKTLCIFLPKMIAYRENFDETKYTSFLIEDDELLEKYDENWGKVKNSLKNDFYNKPIYNENYLKAKIKSYNWKINTNFHSNKIPKEGPQYICLSAILRDSIFKAVKNFYPELFLEECKYIC